MIKNILLPYFINRVDLVILLSIKSTYPQRRSNPTSQKNVKTKDGSKTRDCTKTTVTPKKHKCKNEDSKQR